MMANDNYERSQAEIDMLVDSYIASHDDEMLVEFWCAFNLMTGTSPSSYSCLHE